MQGTIATLIQLNPIMVEWNNGTKSIFTSKEALDFYLKLETHVKE